MQSNLIFMSYLQFIIAYTKHFTVIKAFHSCWMCSWLNNTFFLVSGAIIKLSLIDGNIYTEAPAFYSKHAECLIRSRLAAPPLFLHPHGDEHAKRANCHFCTRFNIQGQSAGQKAIMTFLKHKKISSKCSCYGNPVKQYSQRNSLALEADDSEKLSPAVMHVHAWFE